MNVWVFVGRVGRDAELRTTPKGDQVLAFPVAVDSGFGQNKKTTWPRVQVWGKRAEALQPHIIKGNQIAISGELTLNEYTKADGTKGTSLDVRAAEVTLLKSGADKPAAAPAANPTDDDIPFN